MKGLEDLRRIRVVEVAESWVSCTYDPSRMIGEGYATVIVAGKEFIWGVLQNVDDSMKTCRFSPDNLYQLGLLKQNETYPCADGYWGPRIELIFDSARAWVFREFVQSDAVRLAPNAWRKRLPQDRGLEIIEDGWDHEHCSICWQQVGLGGDRHGYNDGTEDWLCEKYYRDYYLAKDISFVELEDTAT